MPRAERKAESTGSSPDYLLAGQASELERLQLQSRVWEPSGRRLLEEIGDGSGACALDVGCGVLGWLRVLSEWVGPDGEVTGTDVDEAMLACAQKFVANGGLSNVSLVKDDLFASKLEPDSFDLVHARYEICPLGRAHEQMETYTRLARPGGTIVLEDPDPGSWHFNPPAPALERIIVLIQEAFRLSGGDWDAGRMHLNLLGDFGIEGNVSAEVLALPPGHPYLGLPLQFATALKENLLSLVSADELEKLRKGGGGGAPRASPLGHHIHPPSVLGTVPDVGRCVSSLPLCAKGRSWGMSDTRDWPLIGELLLAAPTLWNASMWRFNPRRRLIPLNRSTQVERTAALPRSMQTTRRQTPDS